MQVRQLFKMEKIKIKIDTNTVIRECASKFNLLCRLAAIKPVAVSVSADSEEKEEFCDEVHKKIAALCGHGANEDV